MIRPVFLAILLFISVGTLAQTFKTDTLLLNGPTDKRINLVFLGDGYQSQEMAKFQTDIQRIITDLFNTQPFRSYKDFFNLIAIEVPSNVSGASLDPNNLIDNYFGSTFNFAGIERLLVPTRSSRITQVLINNFPEYDQVFMVVNDDKYGGSGGWVATASTNDASGEIAIHEIGHSFANLADEYWAGSQFARELANMTEESIPELVRWKAWLNAEGVGIYEHSTPGWYRPHQNCKMRFLGRDFCAVCSEAFVNNYYNRVSMLESYSPVDTTLMLDTVAVAFHLNLVAPHPNTLRITWSLDGQALPQTGDSLLIDPLILGAGSHQLIAEIVDTTTWIRGIAPTSTVQWTLNALTTDRQSDLSPRLKSFRWGPNPTSDRLSLSYELRQPSSVNGSLLNSKGQVLQTFTSPQDQLGPRVQTFEVSTLPSGMYLLQLQIEDAVFLFRWQKREK